LFSRPRLPEPPFLCRKIAHPNFIQEIL
jgi:hypothetical protein